MKHNYNLRFILSFVAVLIFSSTMFAQQVAVTEDGREVYLQSDLNKMSAEKRDAITSTDNFIVVNSKEELKELNIYSASDKKVDNVDAPSEEPSAAYQEYQENLKKAEGELEQKVNNGELTQEAADKIYNQKAEEASKGQGFSSDQMLNVTKKDVGSNPETPSEAKNEIIDRSKYNVGSLTVKEKKELDAKIAKKYEQELKQNSDLSKDSK